MNPLDRLREAARVLRERAEAATPEGHTHPWLYTEATYGNPTDGPTHVAVTCCEASGVQVRHFLHADDGSRETSETARYIATMHPGVALALADWLAVELASDGHLPHRFPKDAPAEVISWKCQECGEIINEMHTQASPCLVDWRPLNPFAVRVADLILGREAE